MKSKVYLLLISLGLVALLLISCAPTPTTSPTSSTTTPPPSTTTAPPATTTTAPKPTTTATPSAGQPKYGGTASMAWMGLGTVVDPVDFDQAYRTTWQSWTLDATNECLVGGDWKKGPLGTKELAFQGSNWFSAKDQVGILLEKWEFTEPTTWTLHVRQGVKFQNKPPVNGREMTAQDVAVSIQRMMDMPGSWLYGIPNKPVPTATDKYTVVLKFKEFNASMEPRLFGTIYVVPPEIVRPKPELGPNGETQALRDWKNACGTGPFILTDFVKGSSLTFKKNPDYWQTDPLHPQNKLPYIDSLKVKIIPETPTRIAALRTGAVDSLWNVPWEQIEGLAKTNPELKKSSALAMGPYILWTRNNIEPFSNQKVRQALNMAIDREGMIKDLYQGNAEKFWGLFVHPIQRDVFTPLDQLPANVKEIYTFNPEKAKQLLKEAGYPNGFQTTITTYPGFEDEPVYVALRWKEIGIDAKIDVKEQAIWSTLRGSMTFPGLMMDSTSHMIITDNPDRWATGHYSNYDCVSDPWWDAFRVKVTGTPEEAERVKLFKEANILSLEKAWDIPLPTPYVNVYWQPWLKGYEGSYLMGVYKFFRPYTYLWLDK